jgi:gamma-glutamyltranspeptidase/glutathione hydrolase
MTRNFPLLFLLCALLPAPAPAADTVPEAATGRYPLSTASAGHAMVVTANAHASDAALQILKSGGSAIDAAIAAQAVLGLVEPQSSGFGGGAFIVYSDGHRTLSFDGRETAPATATAKRFYGADGKPMPFYTAVGSGLGMGVPGVLAALNEAHLRYGRLPWKVLFTPAITLARKGFPVSARLHALVARDPLLHEHASTRDYFFDADGTPWPVGHVLKNPAYAAALTRLADRGAKEFYSGRMARQLVGALRLLGPDFTTADWARYRARVTPALCAPFRTFSVCTAPPPSGGWTVLQTLALLDGFPRQDDEALALHRLLEAERLSFADRQRYSADPAFVPVPLDGLFSKDYIAARRALINDRSMGEAAAGVPPGLHAPWGDDGQLREHGTSQLVIADARGQWLSMTSSIEDAFGSRMLVDGMLFNNQLTDFSFVPEENGHPLANRVEPGKRPRSAMSPVIVLDARGRPVLALGSPGGSRIIGFVLRALVASLDAHLTPGEAVRLPLVLSRNGPTEVDSDFPPDLRETLAHDHGQNMHTQEMNSGLAILRRGGDGGDGGDGEQLQGAADPRREGKAEGF